MNVVTRVYTKHKGEMMQQGHGLPGRVIATIFEKREGKPNRLVETKYASENN